VTIGGAVVRRLLAGSEALVFNLDKCGYASDLTSIEQVLAELGPQALDAAGRTWCSTWRPRAMWTARSKGLKPSWPAT
jgi:hypothetical protein